jgi:hypothetical protein
MIDFIRCLCLYTALIRPITTTWNYVAFHFLEYLLSLKKHKNISENIPEVSS